jgi:hypothetical protein
MIPSLIHQAQLNNSGIYAGERLYDKRLSSLTNLDRNKSFSRRGLRAPDVKVYPGQ